MTLKDIALRGICWVRQKREGRKRKGFGNSWKGPVQKQYISHRIWDVSVLFYFCTGKKKYQCKSGFLGTSYLTLPEMEKRTLRGKRRDNPICRCYFPSHLSENFIAVKGIHKKKKVITDAICQPLQQILLYIKHNDMFEMQLFQKPQDSAFRAVQKVLFMPLWILRQTFCSVLFQL